MSCLADRVKSQLRAGKLAHIWIHVSSAEAADTQMADFNYPEMMAPHANFVEELHGASTCFTLGCKPLPMTRRIWTAMLAP